jgi:hypothetical protein
MSDDIVEVSKSLLARLQGTDKLITDVWNDPLVGPKIKELVKDKYPNANIPEVDLARNAKKSESEILTKVEETNKATIARIEAFEKAQKEKEDKDANKKAEDAFASDIEAAKKKYQATDAALEKAFARMKEKNNPDIEAALAWVTDHEPKQTPLAASNYSDPTFNPFGSKGEDKAWETLNRNPWDGKFAEQEIAKITSDFANGRGDLYGPNGMGGQL